MALAVRQAWRKGAKVYLLEADSIASDPTKLPFGWQKVSSFADIEPGEAQNSVVICNHGGEGSPAMALVQRLGARQVFLLEGPNGCGAALLAREHQSIALSRAVADGKVKGLIAVEADIPAELLEGIPFIAALDWHHTDTVRAAGVVLPTTAWVEMDGTFINNEGRAQRFNKVMHPGLPIKGPGPAVHPPRQHSTTVPGGNLRPAWQVLAELIRRLGRGQISEPMFENLAEPLAADHWRELRDLSAEGEGLLVCPQRSGKKEMTGI